MSLTEQNQQEFCNELSTIQDVLRYMVTQFEANNIFFGHGTNTAWDEAIVLLVHFLQINSDNLSHVLDAKLTSSEKAKLYKLIETRINDRMPLPYITKQAWFADLAYYVDKRVLIPRSPLAESIHDNLQPWLELNQDLNILEIGTGSACIACALVNQFLGQGINITVDASDVSKDALDVAKINIAEYGFDNYINLIQSDLFDNIPTKSYDLIISNPPYVDQFEMDNLPAEFLHEPQGALAAGLDGLDLVDKMLVQAKHYLNNNGILIVEVGASKPALEAKYPDIAFTWLDFANGGDGVFMLTKEQLLSIN